MNNWYVITGAPSSGKTTVLNELAKKGFKVIPEMARVYIDEQMKKGKTLNQIRKNEFLFQQILLKKKIALEKKFPQDQIIFMDRAIPDTDAYYRKCGVEDDPFLKKILKDCTYKKVFLFESLKFKKDYARTENQNETKFIEKFLKDAYMKINSKIIRVPKMSVEKRVRFILNNL